MAFVFTCEFPDHLWFHVDLDVWLAMLPGGTARLGMTDPAVTRAGRILFIRTREGRNVGAGQRVASVESSKWIGPIPAPLPGKVVRANGALASDPGLLNRDPYGDGFVAEFHPAVPLEAFREYGLAFGPEALGPYEAKLRREGIHCVRCAEGPPS